jgi:hypothetical protein
MRAFSRSVLLAGVAAVVALAGCTTDAPEAGAPASPTQPAAAPPAAPPPFETEYARLVEHYIRDMVGCLTDLGWEVIDHGDSYESPHDIPDDQFEQYAADVELCEAQFGYDDLPPPYVTRPEAELLYGLLLDVADCIRDLGYDVPDAPSQQAFVEALVTYPIPAWHPYDSFYEDNDWSAIGQIERECPTP